MIILYGLIALMIGGMIYCIWGATQSYKHGKKQKQLANAADYSSIQENGNYKFKYFIKRFEQNGNLFYKIIVDPVLGFSDLPFNESNQCDTINIKLLDDSGNVLSEKKYEVNLLNVSVVFPIEKEQISTTYNFEINTVWILAEREIKESLKCKINN